MDLQRLRGADHGEYDPHNSYGSGLDGLSDVERQTEINAGYDDPRHLSAGFGGKYFSL